MRYTMSIMKENYIDCILTINKSNVLEDKLIDPEQVEPYK